MYKDAIREALPMTLPSDSVKMCYSESLHIPNWRSQLMDLICTAMPTWSAV